VPISSDIEALRARFLWHLVLAPLEMSTEPIQSENEDSAAPPASGPAPTPAAAPPTEASPSNPTQPSSALPDLPPRIDAGEDLDNVLGEVSRMFGQAAGHAAPLASLAEDTINEHLDDLSADAKSPGSPGPPKQEVPLDSAADLFRASSPDDEATDTAADEATLQSPAIPAASVGESTENPTLAAKVKRLPGRAAEIAARALPAQSVARVIRTATSAFESARQIEQRLPKRARWIAGLVAAVLFGWIGGAVFTRSGTSASAEKSATPESTEAASEEMSAEKAKVTALEEQLQKAEHEREAAQHERDAARQRLEQSTVMMRTEQQAVASRRAREEASHKQALEQFQKAEERLHIMELRTYDAQLARVRDCWRRSPGLAATLLEDPKGCPPKLRDFAWGYFYGRAKNDRATWRGSAPVNAVAWSPDGTLVASAGQDGSILLRDGVSGKQIAVLAAHAGGVNAVAFSQRGEWLASAGADATVKLWAVTSRRLEATFFGHLGAVLCVAIAPDSSSLVSGGDDGTVKFWDVASRRTVATRWGHPRNHEPDDPDDPTRYVRAVAFSPDGLTITSGGYCVVRVWSADATEKATLAVPDGAVGALAFSPDSATLAIGSEGSITLRDIDSLVVRSGPQSIDAPVTSLAFSNDGAWLAAATGEKTLVFNRIARTLPDETRSKARPSMGSEPARYDLGDPRPLAGHDGLVTGIAFAPNAQLLATSGADGTVRLWDARGEIVDKTQPDLLLRDMPPATAIAYSPDGRTLAVGTSDAIRLWDVRAGVEMARLENRSGEITRLAFSPDGARLASAGRDWPVLIWSLAAQRVEMALNGHTAGVSSLAYSTDGKMLISAGDDGSVRLWNATNGQSIASLAGHTGTVWSAALSPDGKLAASGGTDQKTRLWSVERKQTVATLGGFARPVVALAFSPDGKFLVSAQGSSPRAQTPISSIAAKPVRVFRIPDGDEVLAFGPTDADICEIAFSPDSKTLAASGPSGVTLWDPRTGELRGTLHLASAPGQFERPSAAPRPVWPIAFSPDGKALAAGGDAPLSIWMAVLFASAPAEKSAATP
jgi:WD40 repeat protein